MNHDEAPGLVPGASSRPGPAEDAALVAARAVETGRPAIGVRLVTDTVKQVDADGFVLGTVDRDRLRTPVVLALPDGQIADLPPAAGLDAEAYEVVDLPTA